MAKLPSGACPILYMDANSSFGLEKTPHGLVTIPSGAVGGYNLGVENHNGKQIRAVLERHFMVLMQTTRELPKSYPCPSGWLKEDCVCQHLFGQEVPEN
eukprot:7908467-Karenia_brevis.AAC.1